MPAGFHLKIHLVENKAKNLKMGVSRKQSTPNFLKNEHFLPPDTHTYNVCFSKNLACFVFLKHPFWDSPFCLITDDFNHNLNAAMSISFLYLTFWEILRNLFHWTLYSFKTNKTAKALISFICCRVADVWSVTSVIEKGSARSAMKKSKQRSGTILII